MRPINAYSVRDFSLLRAGLMIHLSGAGGGAVEEELVEER
jgi:hypothetical protein